MLFSKLLGHSGLLRRRAGITLKKPILWRNIDNKGRLKLSRRSDCGNEKESNKIKLLWCYCQNNVFYFIIKLYLNLFFLPCVAANEPQAVSPFADPGIAAGRGGWGQPVTGSRHDPPARMREHDAETISRSLTGRTKLTGSRRGQGGFLVVIRGLFRPTTYRVAAAPAPKRRPFECASLRR